MDPNDGDQLDEKQRAFLTAFYALRDRVVERTMTYYRARGRMPRTPLFERENYPQQLRDICELAIEAGVVGCTPRHVDQWICHHFRLVIQPGLDDNRRFTFHYR